MPVLNVRTPAEIMTDSFSFDTKIFQIRVKVTGYTGFMKNVVFQFCIEEGAVEAVQKSVSKEITHNKFDT